MSSIWRESNWIVKLQEQAFRRSTLEDTITSEQKIRIKHLLKIFYFRDSIESLRGWKTFCRKGIEDPLKIRIGKHSRFLSFDEWYELLFVEWEDILKGIHDNFIEEVNFERAYPDLPQITVENFEGFYQFFKEYCLIVSNKLSKGQRVGSIENSEFIDELLEKYK